MVPVLGKEREDTKGLGCWGFYAGDLTCLLEGEVWEFPAGSMHWERRKDAAMAAEGHWGCAQH